MSDYLYDDPEAQAILERVRDGGVADLHAAYAEAEAQWDGHKSLCFYYAALYGSIAALTEGRPECMQEIIAHPLDIDMGFGKKDPVRARAIILSEMLFSKQEGGCRVEPPNHAAAIDQAFQRVSSEEKKLALTEELQIQLTNRYRPMGCVSVEALLSCGADPAADKSIGLAYAIGTKQPQETIALLYRYGANFDDARTHMERSLGLLYVQADIDQLNQYKAEMEAASPAPRKLKPGHYKL